MGYEIALDDRCRVFYGTLPVHLRNYTFEYTMWNGIKQGDTKSIVFVVVDHKNYFKVESFMKEPKYFETFNEAECHILKEFTDLRERLREEEDRIQAFLMTSNKKGRKKKNEKKNK